MLFHQYSAFVKVFLHKIKNDVGYEQDIGICEFYTGSWQPHCSHACGVSCSSKPRNVSADSCEQFFVYREKQYGV